MLFDAKEMHVYYYFFNLHVCLNVFLSESIVPLLRLGILKFGSIQRRLRLVLNFDERQKRGKDARAIARVGGHAPPGERRKFPPFFLSSKLETPRSVNQTT